ncbi:MAG: hypothetical protein ABII75_00530, partial [Candidatus Omnitrophota bacterium]
AGISKSAVTKHLPAIEKRLVEEKRPAIKKKLVDVAKVLYRWARNRDEKQINQEWTQKEIAKVAGVSESAISNHFAGLKKRLKKEKLPPIEIKLTPEEKFYQWAIARTVRQINKVWSQRELGRRAGIGESIVPRCLEAVRPRLEREDRPKILVGLTDAYQQLYSWAVARNKQQIKKRWNRRALAEQAGISEASIGNYLGAVQRQLKDENRPKILLGVELSPQEKLYRWVMRRKGKPKQRIAWAVSEIAKGAGISEYAVTKYLPQVQQRLKNERKTLIKQFEITTNPQERIYEWAISRTKKQIDKEWTQREIAAQAGIGRASVSYHIAAVQNRLREQEKPLIKLKLHINNPGGKLYLWALNRNIEEINREWMVEELADLIGTSKRALMRHLLEINQHLINTGNLPIHTELDDKFKLINSVKEEINGMLLKFKREIAQLKNKVNGANNAVNNTKEARETLQKFYRKAFNEMMSALKFLNEINGVRELFPRFKAYAVTIKKIGAAIDIDREYVWTMSERLGKILEIIECHEKTTRKKLVRFELVDLANEALLFDVKDPIKNQTFTCQADPAVTGQKTVPVKFNGSLDDDMGLSMFSVREVDIELDGKQIRCIAKLASVPGKFLRDEKRAKLLRHQVGIYDRLKEARVRGVRGILGYGKIMPLGIEVIFLEKFPRGDTLRELMDKEHSLPDKIKHVDILIKAAQIIEDMHNAGALHRDIKPASIWVPDKDGVEVFDFDLSVPLNYDWKKDALKLRFQGTNPYAPTKSSGLLSREPGIKHEIYALGKTFDEVTFFNQFKAESMLGDVSSAAQLRTEIINKALQGKYRTIQETVKDFEKYQRCLERIIKTQPGPAGIITLKGQANKIEELVEQAI